MSDIAVSFEFTPPYNPEAANMLARCAAALTEFENDFISVNFGGGLVPKDRAFKSLKTLGTRHDAKMVAHIISTGLNKLEVNEIALSYKRAGVDKIIAVRGNPELRRLIGQDDQSYQNAIEMMQALSKLAPFQFIAAGFPEGHPFGAVYENDIEDIKAKIDAGATEIITHFCYDNQKILRFRDALAAVGISVPIRVGILPLIHIKKTYNLARQYKIEMPEKLTEKLFSLMDVPQSEIVMNNLAAHFSLCQMDDLKENGFDKFHFYTLNQTDIILTLCHQLDIKMRTFHNAFKLSEVS